MTDIAKKIMAQASPETRRLNPQIFGTIGNHQASSDVGGRPGPRPDQGLAPAAAIERAKTAEERLNKTERRFLALLRAGAYADKFGPYVGPVRIQAITLVLANRCRYTPDFGTVRMVAGVRQVVLWEVKGGHMWEDSWIKLKAAADRYPEFLFVFAKAKGGEFALREIAPA